MRSDICLSIGHVNFEEAFSLLKGISLAEIRMDLLDLSNEQFISIFKLYPNLIATYRTNSANYEKMAELLNLAIDNGCKYIDIDINVPVQWSKPLIEKAKMAGQKVIISYHNFEQTPSLESLREIVSKIFLAGADIAKVATMANSQDDCSKITRLYIGYRNLIAFCMGEIGATTRLTATFMGAPFTYASVKGKETAPGQLCYDEIEKFLGKKSE